VKTALVAGLLLALGGAAAVAQDAAPSAVQNTFQVMKPPRLSYAEVDWRAAVVSLGDADSPNSTLNSIPSSIPSSILGSTQWPMRTRAAGAARPAYLALARLNAVMAAHFAGLTTSPVPVLLRLTSRAAARSGRRQRARRRDAIFYRLCRQVLLSGTRGL